MQLRVYLFRKFKAFSDDSLLDCFAPIRVQELFSYLLLHRDRPHRREALIETLWGESIPKDAKKYFRQVIWQLRNGLRDYDKSVDVETLAIEEDWINISPKAKIMLDVDDFEQAYSLTREVKGARLTPSQAQALQEAVNLYTGDLLEGCFQDWCLFERERLQNIYLIMLDKLMEFSEVHTNYETGIQYGIRALRSDRAREITYRRLMRLCYRAGDRTAALRYYTRCVEALRTELNVEPTDQTRALWQGICVDRCPRHSDGATPEIEPDIAAGQKPIHLRDLLDSCRALNTVLAEAQEYNENNIKLLVTRLPDQDADVNL